MRIFWRRKRGRGEKHRSAAIKRRAKATALQKTTEMQSITINISNDKLAEKVTWLLEHFKHDGLEIVSREDMEDLKLLKMTRKEKSVPFDEYLRNED